MKANKKELRVLITKLIHLVTKTSSLSEENISKVYNFFLARLAPHSKSKNFLSTFSTIAFKPILKELEKTFEDLIFYYRIKFYEYEKLRRCWDDVNRILVKDEPYMLEMLVLLMELRQCPEYSVENESIAAVVEIEEISSVSVVEYIVEEDSFEKDEFEVGDDNYSTTDDDSTNDQIESVLEREQKNDSQKPILIFSRISFDSIEFDAKFNTEANSIREIFYFILDSNGKSKEIIKPIENYSVKCLEGLFEKLMLFSRGLKKIIHGSFPLDQLYRTEIMKKFQVIEFICVDLKELLNFVEGLFIEMDLWFVESLCDSDLLSFCSKTVEHLKQGYSLAYFEQDYIRILNDFNVFNYDSTLIIESGLLSSSMAHKFNLVKQSKHHKVIKACNFSIDSCYDTVVLASFNSTSDALKDYYFKDKNLLAELEKQFDFLFNRSHLFSDTISMMEQNNFNFVELDSFVSLRFPSFKQDNLIHERLDNSIVHFNSEFLSTLPDCLESFKKVYRWALKLLLLVDQLNRKDKFNPTKLLITMKLNKFIRGLYYYLINMINNEYVEFTSNRLKQLNGFQIIEEVKRFYGLIFNKSLLNEQTKSLYNAISSCLDLISAKDNQSTDLDLNHRFDELNSFILNLLQVLIEQADVNKNTNYLVGLYAHLI